MKSNQKGFTLIELLAVIVILAIIALIATPIVLNIIEKARISAAEDSVYGTMESVKLAYTESLMDVDPISLPLKVECGASGCTYGENIAVEFSGTKPSAGTFVLNSNGFADTNDIVVNNLHCQIVSDEVSCQTDEFSTSVVPDVDDNQGGNEETGGNTNTGTETTPEDETTPEEETSPEQGA